MNQTKLKYARERLSDVLSNKQRTLRSKHHESRPTVIKLTDETRDEQIIAGIAVFDVEKFVHRSSYYRNEVHKYMFFKEDKEGERKLSTWEKKQDAALNKLRDRYEFIEEELMLGDEEAALKLIREFASK